MKKWPFISGVMGIFISFLVFSSFFQAVIPMATPRLAKASLQSAVAPPFHLVAIGDSLTEGVGDSTGQGGFVPLLAQQIYHEQGYEVAMANYGVAGNTSKQILKRMRKDKTIKQSLQEADLLTLTVGGNDILHVIRKNLDKLTVKTFQKPAKEYSERLRKIIDLARQENPDLPIYVLGIYNPFYLNFPELTEMQTVVDNWNQTTEETVMHYKQVYFVPINDKLYKGINGEQALTENVTGQFRVVNDALFEEDHFHPNNNGYQIMKAAIMEKMNETSESWQRKKED
ncbi:SGNH/GDSL hydrolase family protein [Streptococcus ovuberis]|uniref:SGNH/GDSL hydrolase family protein n=1 Tax=Streptococcus ovuberis TaxID=1936207 RepID=A0A7X6S0Q7_9STRE|nr:SGNH/GDSL hydrolase family protein [Streptococcus ovuberis]NKZ19595.1 SGNH/GDSL hydrolase family protein [Streptococcus ovuberis]